MSARLPYNDVVYAADELGSTDSTGFEPRHIPLCFDGLGHPLNGRLAQSVVAPALHAGCRGFESLTAHHPYKLIPLSQGYWVLVSPEDYARFGHLKWSAAVQKKNGVVKRVYAFRSEWIDGKCYSIFLHRLIMGAGKGQKVDHEDRNTLNCRRYNLRFATQRQNCFNRIQKISKHGFIGLESQTPGRFRGRVSAGNVNRYTTTFSSPELAAAARDLLAIEMHGEFAVLNFPKVAA